MHVSTLARSLLLWPRAVLHPRIIMSAPLAMGAPIEVERKFEPPASIEELDRKVIANGGEKRGAKSFKDVYWDTLGCSLTRRDTWLRCRSQGNRQQWELKVPVGDANRSGGERTVFREVEGTVQVSWPARRLTPRHRRHWRRCLRESVCSHSRSLRQLARSGNSAHVPWMQMWPRSVMP